MSQRFSLRFESGERRGEVVPLVGQRLTVGRKSSNDLPITESSVSGQHAELVIDSQGVTLRDLGSTNGTRVGGERVLETRLSAGAVVSFGNVELSFLDARASTRPAEDEGLRVSAEDLARAKRSSKAGPLLLVALGLAGAGAWWWLNQGGGPRGREASRPVVGVQGNLLSEGYSFEGDGGPWSAREEAAAAFVPSGRARYSGEQGLGADLEPGEDALHESPAVPARPGSSLMAAAELRARGGAVARLGLEFTSTTAEPPGPVVAWSEPRAGAEAFGRVELAAAVPAGYDRARVLLSGRVPEEGPAGSVAADDVSLVTGAGGGPAAALDEVRLYTVGRSLNLVRVQRVLISGLAVRTEGAEPLELAALEVEVEEAGLRLRPAAGGPAVATLRAEPAGLAGGLATMGASGYVVRGDDFEDEAVTDVLLGRGAGLVRLAFGAPVAVRARAEGAAFRFRVALPPGAEPLLQTRFQAERTARVNLVADAEAAEERGAYGECLRLWGELLDRYPFDEGEVARAEAVRTRLLRNGVEELRAVAAEVERARFFRLVDIYRQCRARAEAVAARYAGSEVEQGARELLAEIAGDLVALEADLDRHEVERLRAIHAALVAQGAEGLSRELEGYLAERYGVSGDPGEER